MGTNGTNVKKSNSVKKNTNAKKTNTSVIPNKKNINILVRATAAVVAILLTFYFVVTLNNMSSITSHVEERKDGTYPVSIAAGHIETSLSKTLSVMQMVLALDKTTVQEISEGDTPIFDPVAVEELNRINDQEIKHQMTIITSDRFVDEENIHELVVTYDAITKEMRNAFAMWEGDPSNLVTVQDQIANNVIPKIEHAIAVDNAILDSTTRDIDMMYTTVLDAIQQTLIFSFVLIMGIFVAIFIYVSLLRRKEEYEQELSDYLRDALVVAQNANAAKSTFLSNVSHDIRTPLNAIIGLSAIAEDNINNPMKMRQCLTQINTSSHHLLQLINNVLDVNRIESGKTILAEDTFSLPELVSELTTMNESQINEKKLNAEFMLQDIQHEYLIGDPIRLRQIMLNLISNAIKYTNPGDSIMVTFEEYRSSRKDYANLRITVSDTGVGMKEGFLGSIFEPFEREQNDRTDFIEGTGLGMAITKNLVTMMGGTIKVESQLGQGTVFTVELALRIADQIPKLDTDLFKGVKILVASDDITAIDNAIVFLDEFGMDTRKLAIIPGEIDMINERIIERTSEVDAILVGMSNLNKQDYERLDSMLCSIVHDKQIAVIRVSETLQPIIHNEGDLGVTAHIERPVFRSRLYETLREVLKIIDDNSKQIAANSLAADDNATKKDARVLIVEDNELNMDIATELIAKLGPQVDQAFNGAEAVELIKGKPEGYYNLIFMDWQMPVMDGIEATKAITRYFDEQGYKRTPIIAMTANVFNDNRREAMAVGMDGFMTKPINIKELKDYIEKYTS